MLSTHRIHRLLMPWLLALLLGACQPIQLAVELEAGSTLLSASGSETATADIDCDSILPPTLRELEIGEITLDGARDRLATEMNVISAVDDLVEQGDKQQLVWLDDRHRNILHFTEELLQRVTVYFEDNARPSMAVIVDCLGEPDFYAATIETRGVPYLAIDLWYTEWGIFVRTSQFLPTLETPPLNEDLLATAVSRLVAADVETMIRARYGVPFVRDPAGIAPFPEWSIVEDWDVPEGFLEHQIEGVYPWRGWSEIKVRNCYSPFERCPDVYPW